MNQPEILDLEISDEEYIELVNQGRDPVLEKLYEWQLERLQSARRSQPGSQKSPAIFSGKHSQKKQVSIHAKNWLLSCFDRYYNG